MTYCDGPCNGCNECAPSEDAPARPISQWLRQFAEQRLTTGYVRATFLVTDGRVEVVG